MPASVLVMGLYIMRLNDGCHGNSKYLDRNFLSNSVDPDQTASKEQSDQRLHYLSASQHRHLNCMVRFLG